MNKIYSLILKPVLAFLFVLGLSFIIPVILSASLPEDITSLYASVSFLIVSVILIIISVAGTLYISKDIAHMFRNLGLYSIIPGVIAMITTVFGREVLVVFFSVNSETLQPIITAYLDARVPKLWILTASYLILGIVLYYIGRKLK